MTKGDCTVVDNVFCDRGFEGQGKSLVWSASSDRVAALDSPQPAPTSTSQKTLNRLRSRAESSQSQGVETPVPPSAKVSTMSVECPSVMLDVAVYVADLPSEIDASTRAAHGRQYSGSAVRRTHTWRVVYEQTWRQQAFCFLFVGNAVHLQR